MLWYDFFRPLSVDGRHIIGTAHRVQPLQRFQLGRQMRHRFAVRVVVGRGHEVFRAFGPFEAMGKAVRAGVAVAAGCLTAVQPLVGTGRAEVELEVLPLFPAGGIIEFHSISLLFCIKVPPLGHALCSFLEAVFVSGVRRMARIFTRRQGDFPQRSLVDRKGKQRSIRIKRPLRRCAMLTKTASQGGTR